MEFKTKKEKQGYGEFLQDGGRDGFLKRVAVAKAKKEEKKRLKRLWKKNPICSKGDK